MRKMSFDPLVIPLLLLLATSCNKTGLDPTVTNNLDSTSVFKDSTYSIGFLNNIYTHIGFAADPKRFGGGGLDASCDEAEGPNSSSSNGYMMFATGTVNASIVPNDAWSVPYSQIRAINQ